LAHLHIVVARRQPGAFLPRLGLRFLREYYRLSIAEGDALILCAEDPAVRIAGFVSGTLSNQTHYANLSHNAIRLLFSLSPWVLLSPSIRLGVWRRRSALVESPMISKCIAPSSCRIEYWAWDAGRGSPSLSVKLLLGFLKEAERHGARSVTLEVDVPSRHVWITHQILGARVIGRFKTADMKDRMILEYSLLTPIYSPIESMVRGL
jgi:hypothetical protein